MKFYQISGAIATVAMLLAASACRTASADPAAPFYLHDGDRVVMYGDSITDQRLYTTWTEAYVQTRFPKMKVDWTDSGWGGDRVTGGGGGPIDLRLSRDVLAYKPTVVTSMLGMNDGNYRAYDDATFQIYSKGYQHIVQTVKAGDPGVRLTLIIPSAYDDVTQKPMFEGGYNATLVKFGDYISQLAAANGATVADFNAPMVTMLQAAYAANPSEAQAIIPGRVHPSPAGHLIMAEQLLKAWNAPSLVASVTLDAAKQTATADNATITGATFGANIKWDELDNALPFPYSMKDPVTALALSSSDFIAALDQEPLTVTGLTGANYDLTIDSTDIGNFTAAQLTAGVNLATYDTPMYEQSLLVYQQIVKHDFLHTERWQRVQVPFAGDKSPGVSAAAQALMTALDNEEQTEVENLRAASQPVLHHFTLTPKP